MHWQVVADDIRDRLLYNIITDKAAAFLDTRRYGSIQFHNEKKNIASPVDPEYI